MLARPLRRGTAVIAADGTAYLKVSEAVIAPTDVSRRDLGREQKDLF